MTVKGSHVAEHRPGHFDRPAHFAHIVEITAALQQVGNI